MSGTYVAPEDLAGVLAAIGAGHRPVAGGTDLVVGARQSKRTLPESLVSLHRVKSLHGVKASDASIQIGASTNHGVIAADSAIRAQCTALADAATIIGSPATRHLGTIGGNIANASPGADTVGALLCFDATLQLSSSAGTRDVSVGEFLIGPGKTSLKTGELLTQITLPLQPALSSAYVRLEYRRQMEIAVVGATAAVSIEGGKIKDARIAITAAAATVLRIADAEAALVGTDGGRGAADAAAKSAASAAKPISDTRASAEYRRAMVAVVVRRAIQAAVSRAKGDKIAIPASSSTFGAV